MTLGAGLLLSLLVAAPARSKPPSFAVREPERPIPLKLSSPSLKTWGHVPAMRLIYYVAEGQAPNDLDRETIRREVRLIKDFYSHYGLVLDTEETVYEILGHDRKELRAAPFSYHAVLKALEEEHLLLPHRTIVFTTFDVGLGDEMALTGLNDANTAKLECPRPGKGFAWWCGRPEAAHWGGSVHEVGHMLGLAHPDEYTAASPYDFSGGTRTYVYDKSDAERSVMIRHDRFFRHRDNGLLPHEIDLLYRRYHDAGAPEPELAYSPSGR